MTMNKRILTLAVAAAALAAPAAWAQPSPAFQRAILAEVSPQTRAEIQRRATGGNSVSEVMAVILLNNLSLANTPNAKVVAVDFTRETAVVDVPGEGLKVIKFNPKNLTIRR
jgi:hypothetical protein